METWIPIPGWAERYEVSDAGHVRSKDMAVPAGPGGVGTAIRRGRTLKLVVKGGRYRCVTLARGATREQWFVHDLVALAFVGPKPPGLETRHLNDHHADNRATNIAYGTREENEADRQANGKVMKGESHGCAKLTEEEVLSIRSSPEGSTELSRRHGVSPSHIWAIRNRRVWRHI